MEVGINDKIDDWLFDQGDYSVGIALLSQVCKKRALINTLLVSQSNFNKNKIIYELEKHLKSASYGKQQKKRQKSREIRSGSIPRKENDAGAGDESINQPREESSGVVHSDVYIPGVSGDNSPLSGLVLRKLDEIKRQRNDCYAQRDHLHPKLSIVESNTERFELAGQIRSLTDEITTYNQQMSELEANNSIPLALQDRNIWFELEKKLQNTKKYITKYKLLVKNAESIKKRDHHQGIVDKYEKELIILQKQAEN